LNGFTRFLELCTPTRPARLHINYISWPRSSSSYLSPHCLPCYNCWS